MHEGSLMASALEMALAQARQAGASRVHHLRLRVGELSGVVPEALQFAFEALRVGGPAAEAVLEIETVSARYLCEACRSEFAAGTEAPRCPGCGSQQARLIQGRELELMRLEVS